MFMNKENLKWYERKRLWCGLPWTFTKYGFSETQLFVETGLFTTKLFDTRLYRVTNTSISRSLIQKLFLPPQLICLQQCALFLALP